MRDFMFRVHLPYNLFPPGVGDKYIELTVTARDKAEAIKIIGAMPPEGKPWGSSKPSR